MLWSPIERILTALIFTAFLGSGMAVAGDDRLTNLRIEGPTVVEPDADPPPAYTVRWDGGTPPWSVRFNASEPARERVTEQVVSAAVSCFDSEPGSCALPAIPVFYQRPHIATITAVVRDATGASIARQLRVRVASEGPLHVPAGFTTNVRPDPEDANGFLCRGGPDDPRFIGVTGPASSPQIDVHRDPDVPDPASITVVGRDVCGFPLGVLYGIADADFQQGEPTDPEIEQVLSPPVSYGAYGRPDTKPWRDPLIPSPPLKLLESYEVQVPRPPGCNDGLQTRFQTFQLNPPQSGDAVVGTDEPSQCFNSDTRVERSQPFEIGVRNSSAGTVFLGCVNERFLYLFLARLENLRDAQFFEDDDEDELIDGLIFETFGNPERIEAVRERCAAEALGGGAKGNEPVELGIRLLSGRVRVTVPASGVLLAFETPQLAIDAGSGFEFQIDQTLDGPTIVSPLGQSLTVVPLDGGETPRIVEPGFFVTADGSGIAEPRVDRIFSDNFD